MPITVGTRLATYDIVARLGAGGMGEVFRARDTKLDRDVALKILPETVADDSERLARFEREARALAALNHPNIAHVYDSGSSAGTSYLVMELVAGDDLSALIRRGPLPIADALAIAGQIVDALETAHDAGIVHRDLKPANIKVRPDGTVKVLDFGLAKAVQARTAGDFALASSPTVTLAEVTTRGVILGTTAYVSPEQARGEPVDRRSDIWAFGAVLYEMLTGKRAFDGENVTDVLGAVARLDPDWAALPSELPLAVLTLLRGCLVKDRRRRIADISTARFVIDTASSLAGTVPAVRANARRRSIALAASTVVLAVISATLLWALLRAEPTEVTRYTVTPSEDQPVVHVGSGIDTALSPDGSWMVYVGKAPGGGTMLLRRNLDDLNAVAVPGSEGATAPTVSPDGNSIAFVFNGGIRTLPSEGGPPFTVVTSGSAPTWSDDDMLYYGLGNVVYRVSARGGEAAAVTTAQTNIVQRNPDALPNGRGLILTLFAGTPAQARIAVVGPDGGTVRPILTGTMARYASGHIIYGTVNGTLMAAPFDAARLEVTGPSVPLVEGVAVDADGSTQFTVSRSGALLYSTGTGFESELVWVTRDGVATPMDSMWTGEFTSPALSPDGTRLAVALQSPESRDIWVDQLDRGSKLRLTLDGTRNDYPTWTPDGGSITFSSDRVSPSFDLWTKRSDGSGEPRLELDEEPALAEALWSPDGEWFVHRTSTNVAGAGDIMGRRTGKDTRTIPLAASRFTELAPAISPNSRWMAYSSTETGRTEIVVVPFPNTNDSKWTVSVGGGSEPLWSRDGKELFYRNAKGELVSVRVETQKTFSIGATTVLFPDGNYMRLSTRRQYDVMPDGQRFVMIRPVGSTRERRVILVRNVFSERTRAKN